MENEKVALTEEGLKALEARRDLLKDELIPEVIKRTAVARAQGDLSENAEYHAAKDEHAKLEGELQEIEYKIKHAEVIKKDKSGVIQVGSTVTYVDLTDKEEYTFTIVGTTEANLAEKKISNESPIGVALIGNKNGATVTVKAPKGLSYQIKIKDVN